MRRYKHVMIGAAVAVLITTSGCTTVAQWTADTAQSLSSSTPTQVSTLADAEIAAKGVHQAISLAANSGKMTRAQLGTLGTVNDNLNKAMTDLETANANGQSLAFAALNEVLAQWISYSTAQGISH